MKNNNNNDNPYNLAIEARRLLNETMSHLKLMKLDTPDYNTDPILESEILKLENQLNEDNKYLKSFENEWM